MRVQAALIGAVALLIGGCEEKKPARIVPPVAALAPTAVKAQPQAQAPAIPPSSQQPKPDPVPQLVADAESEYQRGQAEYTAGDFDAAKVHFDKAIATLTQAPLDIDSDDRLRVEFEKIVEGLNRLEASAPKDAETVPEQKTEPAPIDEANDITVPADANVKAKAEAELRQTRSDIPLVINDYVAGYINFFTNSPRGRNTLINGWQRAGRYREMIFRILREEGVPQDLFYLAQAESGFHPLAVSRVGARGMWQFMRYTAPGYELKKNWWMDDRQDPEKSTRAAARHLKDLFNQFGDWWLAMAAYNSGAGNIQRAVQRTGYADFWELYRRNVLPRETKNYVPIIVAMTIVAKNPAQYGLDAVAIESPLQPDVVTTNYALDLRLAADAVDASLEEMAELNPALIRRMTPRDIEYDLKLPHGSKEKFNQTMAAIPPERRMQWRLHKVSEGETLYTLAKKYRVSQSAISQANSLDGAGLPADSKLVIPLNGKLKFGPGSGTYAKKATRYRVRRGDTISSVAEDFGVPPERLKRWNGLKGNNLRAGRTLFIYPPLGPSESSAMPRKAKRRTKSGAANNDPANTSQNGKR